MVGNTVSTLSELNTKSIYLAKTVNWIKLSVTIFNDEKMRIIEGLPEGDAIIVIWLKLLTLAGRTNDRGLIYLTEGIPYTENQIALILNKPLPILQLALTTLRHFSMIQMTNDGIWITNWEKHQNTQALERIRGNQRKASASYRQRQKEPKLPMLLTQGKDASYDASYNVITQNKIKNKKENKKENKSIAATRSYASADNFLLKENVIQTTPPTPSPVWAAGADATGRNNNATGHDWTRQTLQPGGVR